MDMSDSNQQPGSMNDLDLALEVIAEDEAVANSENEDVDVETIDVDADQVQAAPRGEQLEGLHLRRMEAEAAVSEVMELVEHEYEQHRNDILTIGENLVTIVNSHTESCLNELAAARNQMVEKLDEKVREFMESNKFAQDEIERQNVVEHGLKETIRQLGLRF